MSSVWFDAIAVADRYSTQHTRSGLDTFIHEKYKRRRKTHHLLYEHFSKPLILSSFFGLAVFDNKYSNSVCNEIPGRLPYKYRDEME